MVIEQLAGPHQDQFLLLIRDFAENDKKNFLRLFGDKSWDSKSFLKFVKDCDKSRMDWRPGADKVSLTHYVLRDHGVICGYGRMRFPLNEETEKHGGNLEFYVPPAKRGHGYGALTLNRMLFEAVRAGMARALVTCNAYDTAAIRCVENNRGELIDDGDKITARFWIRFR